MSWIVDDWRLKLLALGLAVLMLGAVAFAQNPPTTKPLALPLHYTTVGQGDLVIISPPSTVNVTIQGPADSVGNATADNFSATVDATHATQGPAVKLNITVTPTINGISVVSPAPIVVRVDKFVAIDVPVAINAHGASNWRVNTDPKLTFTTPTTVHFVGPASWEDHIAGTVTVGPPISVTTTQLLNQPVLLTNLNGAVSITPCTTAPCATLDPANVAVTINAQSGTTSTTVALVADTPSQPPPPGYQVTGVNVNPATVIITGDPAALVKLQRIILPKVDLTGVTASKQFQVSIPYPDGVSPLNGVQTATITYTIQRNPSVTPSPSP